MATEFLIAAGEAMHLLAKSASKIIDVSPAAATNFPTTALHDSIPSVIFRHASAAATNRLDADLNLLENGDFETWDGSSPDKPTGWTLEGSTTVTKETANPIAGSASVRVDGAIYRDVDIPSGALCAFRGKMAEFGATTANAQIQIIDRETGEFLDQEGAWNAAETDLFVESTEYAAAGDERTKGLTFTAQPFSTIKRDLTKLRIRLLCGGENDGDDAIFDELSLIVVPNLVSVHGHNIPSKFRPQVRTSRVSSFTDRPQVAVMDADAFTARDALAKTIDDTPSQSSFYYRLRDNAPLFKGAGALSLSSGVVARADSKKVTVSLWLRRNGDDSNSRRIFQAQTSGAAFRLFVTMTATNQIQLTGRNSAGTNIVSVTSVAEALPPDTDVHNVVFSADTTNDGGGNVTREQVRVDGVDKLGTGASVVDGEIDFANITAMHWDAPQAAHFSVNEAYIQPDFSEDLGTAANVEKFRSPTGDRVDLGSDGSTPSGAAAWIYQYGEESDPVNTFAKNRGDGGGPFTVVGTIGSELMFGSSRFWRLNTNTAAVAPGDVPAEAIEYGQWLLVQTQALLHQRTVPHSSPRSRPAMEQVSVSGHPFRAAMSGHDTQGLSLPFRHLLADRDQWLELRERSAGGTLPVVIVPDTDKAEVHFGLLSIEYDETTDVLDQFPTRVGFIEFPFVQK